MPTPADNLSRARDALTDAIFETLPDNDYGLQILNLNKTASRFDIILTFKTGRTYCCQEPVCHLGFCDKEFWATIRQSFDDRGLRQPPPMKIKRITTIVEPGARFATHPHFGLPLAAAQVDIDDGEGWSEHHAK